jgi:dGTPase
MKQNIRDARRYSTKSEAKKISTANQRDRDRILYSSSFRRLANVTQVVNPRESHVFHNRLTHSLEVAQIARQISEKFLQENKKLADDLGGLDPDVVEAAALAHDLGHPPFGHIAETELDRLAKLHGLPDGFEGNAQLFRIVTRTTAHRLGYEGLNLTRATLNAVLKYPWLRAEEANKEKHEKFGAYLSEQKDFEFARKGFDDDRRCLEAAIMDYADDIAYSVHDVDDFYRVGLIPIEFFVYSDQEFENFFKKWERSLTGNLSIEEIRQHKTALREFTNTILVQEDYTGTINQRSALRSAMSHVRNDFINAVSLKSQDKSGNMLEIDRKN